MDEHILYICKDDYDQICISTDKHAGDYYLYLYLYYVKTMNVNTSLPTNHTAHPPPAVPTPINIYQWIRSADGCYTPSADYVKCAVNLAWMLTKHLMDLLASGTIAITDIRVDTVIICYDFGTVVGGDGV